MVGATLVCLTAVEVAAGLVLWLLPAQTPHLARQDAPKRWGDGAPLAYDWHPYVYWRARPRDGHHVNVDALGLRRTWNREVDATNALQVFVFGGSTAWGPGARDAFTIPSLLSKRFAAELDEPVVVTNFGQGAYVTTQELLALMIELQRGNVPDVAVFYHGVNDVFASYEAKRAGIPQSETWRQLDFENAERAFLARLARRSRSLALIRRLTGEAAASSWQPTEAGEALTDLARDTVHVYVENLRLIEALAHDFGFDVLFYWQPIIWSKQPLAEYESHVAEHMDKRFPSLGEFAREVYERVRQSPDLRANPHFRNLSRSFDSMPASVFWDWCHVTEAGNLRIAEEIEVDVRERLAKRRTNHTAGRDPASRETEPVEERRWHRAVQNRPTRDGTGS
jgi:hypothetical protein